MKFAKYPLIDAMRKLESNDAMRTGKPLLLLGASVRALAQSCRRAGFSCRGADLFGDVDGLATCPLEVAADYPRQLLEIARRHPPGPWLYAGGLENHPQLIDAIAGRRPLWGIGGRPLRGVRDPVKLHRALRQARLPTPQTTREIDLIWISAAQRWLCKPLRSCAGADIAPVDKPSTSGATVKGRACYYQAYMEGTPAAAVFVADRGRARLLGVTRQIIGVAWAGASGFQYAGSVGPMALSDACAAQITRIGDVVAEEFALRGLFGVDGVLRDDQFWVVEVNPRYTASVEILERASGIPAMAWHAGAFCDDIDCQPDDLPNPSAPAPIHGKAIVYAPSDVRVGDAFGRFVAENNCPGAWPQIADIPHRGATIQSGHPIATLFAAGAGDAIVMDQLRRRCNQLRNYLEAP